MNMKVLNKDRLILLQSSAKLALEMLAINKKENIIEIDDVLKLTFLIADQLEDNAMRSISQIKHVKLN